jgi:hypothetical protein
MPNAECRERAVTPEPLMDALMDTGAGQMGFIVDDGTRHPSTRLRRVAASAQQARFAAYIPSLRFDFSSAGSTIRTVRTARNDPNDPNDPNDGYSVMSLALR